jgi:hypothetical protein
MSVCPFCSGTGQTRELDQYIPNETKLRLDPDLRAFMEQTDLRSEEERMLQYLYPRMFDPDAAFDLLESYPVRKHAPVDLKDPPAPSVRAHDTPVRTGGDVLRESKERGTDIPKQEPPPRIPPMDPHAAKERMKDIGKGLGF